MPRRTGLMTVDALLAGNGQVFWNAINHLILPASLLGFHSLAYISRMTRSFMLAQLSQEFIITARVKGLTERQVIWNHAFRNILVQLLTVVALAYGALLEGAVLIETVFSWPGFGSYLTGSLLLGDMNAVMGCVLLVGVIFAMLNLLSDMLYQFFDPRQNHDRFSGFAAFGWCGRRPSAAATRGGAGRRVYRQNGAQSAHGHRRRNYLYAAGGGDTRAADCAL